MHQMSKERLDEILEFDEAISRFRWKPRDGDTRSVTMFNGRFAGRLAGAVRDAGVKLDNGLKHRVVNIDGKRFYEHRLVWLHYHGAMPSLHLDHLNGDGLDNRIENLREATREENLKNTAMHKDNTSGYTGISWHKASNKYRVSMRAGGKQISGGYFKKEDLHLAVVRAKELRANLGYSPTHGLTREQRKAETELNET